MCARKRKHVKALEVVRLHLVVSECQWWNIEGTNWIRISSVASFNKELFELVTEMTNK